MYLTRAYLNPRRRGALQLLGNPQRMHASVLAGFPDPQTTTAEGRVLWRLDTDSTRAILWVVSPTRPDLTHLIEQAGWPQADNGEQQTKPYTPLLERLKPGQRYAFRLTATPTKRLAVAEGKLRAGAIKGHTTNEQQQRWLIERAERHGFTIPESSAPPIEGMGPPLQLQLRNRHKTRFDKNENGTSSHRRVTLTQVTYEGILEVHDPDTLRATLTTGIGRARAYGCGLLTIAPPRQS